jgi:hypothetical protein
MRVLGGRLFGGSLASSDGSVNAVVLPAFVFIVQGRVSLAELRCLILERKVLIYNVLVDE